MKKHHEQNLQQEVYRSRDEKMWDHIGINKKENSMISFAEFVKLTEEEKDDLARSIRYRNAPWRKPFKIVLVDSDGTRLSYEEQCVFDVLFAGRDENCEEDYFADLH